MRKNKTCSIALIFYNKKILMGLREYEKNNPVWTLPGGKCKIGESPRQCLKREVKEETGITKFKIIYLIGKKKGTYKDSNGHDEVYMYKCSTDQEAKLMEPEKFIKWKWFDLNLLPKNLIDPKDFNYIRMA